MARCRQTPRCPWCDEVIAKAVYKKPDHNFVGDTFLYWKFLGHDCKNKPALVQPIQEVELNNEDDAFEDFVCEIVRYYNGTEDHHIRFADVEIYIPDIVKELKQSFIIKRKI